MKLDAASVSRLVDQCGIKPVEPSTCRWVCYTSSPYNTLVKKNQNARDGFHAMEALWTFSSVSFKCFGAASGRFHHCCWYKRTKYLYRKALFYREIPTFPENIRRRQDGRYRLIVSNCGRCYRFNQLLKDGPHDQGSVHPMTLWVKWYHGENADDFSD